MTTAATPPTEPPSRRIAFEAFQQERDEQHLRTLVVFYCVLAAMTLVFGCLCVYTFVILTRPDVIERFGGRNRSAIGR